MIYALRVLMEILSVTKWKKIPLVVMTEDDYRAQQDSYARLLREREALFCAVEGVCQGESPCAFCEDFKECQREARGAVIPYCDGWWPNEDIKPVDSSADWWPEDIGEEGASDEPSTAEEAAENPA